MDVIPGINGPIRRKEGVCSLSLPLTYRGDCTFAGQFPLVSRPGGLLTYETDLSVPAEGYRLTVEEQAVTLAAWDENGKFYGTQTLFRMVEETGGQLPCGVYEDAPLYRHRGFMLDVSRHFFPLDRVKKLVDQCAKLKLNMFHWHLSDDQGFRIESKKFPRLNEIGSWRTEPDGSRYGGFYTQAEIRELVEYAAERFVQVIPEIDLPGHTAAIVAAYPELSCSGELGRVENGPGVFPRILCAGNEKVYAFLEELLEEICPLFEEDFWFHIGGDEAPKEEWKKCPKCQAAIRRLGLENEEELQAHFTGRLTEILGRQGQAVIGWNEILASGKMAPNAAAQFWTETGAAYSAREAEKGRRFIFSADRALYFCREHALATLRGAYEYRPHIPGAGPVPGDQILGLEAAMWTEHVAAWEELERLAFPRLAALAENAWTKEKDYEGFLARLARQEALWEREGVVFTPVKQADEHTPAAAAGAVIRQLMMWSPAEGEQAARQKAAALTGRELIPLLSPSYTAEETAKIQKEIRKLTL